MPIFLGFTHQLYWIDEKYRMSDKWEQGFDAIMFTCFGDAQT